MDEYRKGQTNAELAEMLRRWIACPSDYGYDSCGFCLMDHVEQVAEALESHSKAGVKGGKARANRLTASQRSEIAKRAANVPWGKG